MNLFAVVSHGDQTYLIDLWTNLITTKIKKVWPSHISYIGEEVERIPPICVKRWMVGNVDEDDE